MAHQQRQAALAFCGKIELAAWEESSKPAFEQVDRAVKAAGLAPRIALAPLILRLSEARAEVKKLPPPPPCAAEAFKLLQRSMELREDALVSFASKEGDAVVSAAFIRAEKTSQEAFSKLARARAVAIE